MGNKQKKAKIYIYNIFLIKTIVELVAPEPVDWSMDNQTLNINISQKVLKQDFTLF